GSPVIIYVYGGAWDSGHKSMMMPMAQNLANQGYIVIVPDYTRYPQAKIEDMVRDVQDAVVWTSQNATRYGGDPSNIYLMGSGSGAHVASLAIMNDAIEQLGGIPAPAVEGDHSPLERVQGLILFSGVFDITFYFAYLHKRGIEEVSAMPRVMHQSANNYLACSPSWILSTATENLQKPELLEQVLPKTILIVHGEQDRLIPAHSSQTLFNLLCAAEIPNIKFKVYTGQSHLDPAIDLILPSNAI
ncbi:MAG: Alpha/Beta hydrolase protein, partial [Linnemannia elongata]